MCVLWFFSFLYGFVSRPKDGEQVKPVFVVEYGAKEIENEMNICVREMNSILDDNQFMSVEK